MQEAFVQFEQEKLLETLWEGSHPHLRKQEKLVRDCGGDVEAAAQELVHPTRQSFREELAQRPLDKGILEEIYMNLHGKRIERKLKKGLSWEHWIAKGEGTAPVFTASRKAQQAFGMGSRVDWWASATDASQFPLPLSTRAGILGEAGGLGKKKKKKKKTAKDSTPVTPPPSQMEREAATAAAQDDHASTFSVSSIESAPSSAPLSTPVEGPPLDREVHADTKEDFPLDASTSSSPLSETKTYTRFPAPPSRPGTREEETDRSQEQEKETEIPFFSSSTTTTPPSSSAGGTASIPRLPPEFVFIGRTSSGKSSLLNAILNAAVAPYGHLQGTTTAVNFYRVGGSTGGGQNTHRGTRGPSGGAAGALTLVDCPGYGYYNPLQTPAAEAANAVRVMVDYLQHGAPFVGASRRGSLGPRMTVGEGEGKRRPKKRNALSHATAQPHKDPKEEEERKGDGPSPHFFHGLAGLCPPHRLPRSPTGQGKGGGRGMSFLHRGMGGKELEVGEAYPLLSTGVSLSPLCRRPIQRVFLCASSRGLQHLDWHYCDLLESLGISFTVVLTKTDAAPIRFLARLTDYTRCRLVQYRFCKELMLTSALRLSGIDKMQHLIGSMVPTTSTTSTTSYQKKKGTKGEEEEADAMDFTSLV